MTTPLPLPGAASSQMSASTNNEHDGLWFRDQLWLNSYPLDRNLVFDYFVLSPFYDWSCNNEQIRLHSIHPLDLFHLTKMANIQYALSEVMELHLFVIRKQKRGGPDKNDAEDENRPAYSKGSKERIDINEVRRIDHILASLQHKKILVISSNVFTKDQVTMYLPVPTLHVIRLPPAPPPPAFPEGYNPPTTETEKPAETQQVAGEAVPSIDTIIDQGPSKRMQF